MRIIPVIRILGFMVLASGAAMSFCIAVSLYFDGTHLSSFLSSTVITIAAGSVMMLVAGRFPREELRPREGFAIVTLGWAIVPVFGSLPFLLSGAIPSVTDAYFESVSGFTTTGASILSNVEALSKELLFWRSLTQWLGGMGIIVLSLAVLPLLGVGGMQLFKAEFAGPTKDKLTPRIAETARLLWTVYAFLTAVETGLLYWGGMGAFDALCHSFTTIASGGFSTKNAGMAAYDSPFIHGVVTFFMFAAATNFPLHYSALRGRIRYFQDDEFRFYFLNFFLATLILALLLAPDLGFWDALRHAAFNVISVMSSTGFASADFAQWAPLAQVILLLLMFPGACAGSTGGGMKNVRVLLLLKTAGNELKRLVHPQAVIPVRFKGRMIEQDILFNVAGFIILFLVTLATATMVVTAAGLDLVTALSAVASAMSNVGPGLGAVGPMENYGGLPDFVKWVLGACMVIGRLEIFTVFVLFSKTFWKS